MVWEYLTEEPGTVNAVSCSGRLNNEHGKECYIAEGVEESLFKL